MSARGPQLPESPAGGPAPAKLTIVPCTISDACSFVAQHHRHHQPPQGGLFALAVAQADQVVGVAIVGRPVARHLADGWTAEVTRVATDGTRNACSKLYGAAWRASRALGWRKLITYTLDTEPGDSLRGAGWTIVGTVPQRSWDRPGRPRVDRHPTQGKLRWEAPPP
jgi:hypothetical protein